MIGKITQFLRNFGILKQEMAELSPYLHYAPTMEQIYSREIQERMEYTKIILCELGYRLMKGRDLEFEEYQMSKKFYKEQYEQWKLERELADLLSKL